MNYLTFILIILLILSVLLSLASLNEKRTAFEIINDMGIGWNMGNTFECYSFYQIIKSPDQQITLWGNIKPTKNLLLNLKKHGFKTIRIPITWMYFMNEEGIIDKNWLIKIKEVVDLIFELNMYCIINVHNDGTNPFWLSKGLEPIEKFKFLWKQISEEFQKYDDHLIFECMNDIDYGNDHDYDYNILYIYNQEFINVIRNSENFNKERLLILSGAKKELSLTCSSDFKLPIDPYNKFAISIHYYLPTKFAIELDSNPWYYIDGNGIKKIVTPMTQWGADNDYLEAITNFERLKETYIDKGIPIIITETGVLTEEKKELESIRKYLHFIFSLSSSYNGIMSCLWDTSNKLGNMNYFDRINNKFYDEKIGQILKKISKGKFIKPTEFYIFTNIETINKTNSDGNLEIKFGAKKVVKVIFNCNILIKQRNMCGFGIASNDKNGKWSGIQISGSRGKRQYDGSFTFTYDSTNSDLNDYVQIQKWWGDDNIIFNYLTLEYNNSYYNLDYNGYREALLKI